LARGTGTTDPSKRSTSSSETIDMTARKLLISVLLLACAVPALGQPATTPPLDLPADVMRQLGKPPMVVAAPADDGAIPLYGANTPGSLKTESWSNEGHNLVVRNVTRPTLTPVLPDLAIATGAAVIIAPGGGFTALSTETEGFQVAHVLASHGIAGFVLKYRLVATPKDESEARMFSLRRLMTALSDPAQGGESLRNPESTADGLAALALVRSNAAKWGIDPARVGIMGFSAGAMTSLSTGFAPDAVSRPSFIGFVYGPQIAVTVPVDAPPLFDAIALDDPIFPSMGFPIVADWHKAKRPVELHAYGRGGHGFGLGLAGTTPTLLMDEFMAWLGMQGFLQGPAQTRYQLQQQRSRR
jgi:dienelactone hydrolase